MKIFDANKFIIYTKPGCVWCDRAISLLNAKNVAMELRSLSIQEHMDFVLGQGFKTVPQIYYGDEYIGGHDDLVTWLEGSDV